MTLTSVIKRKQDPEEYIENARGEITTVHVVSMSIFVCRFCLVCFCFVLLCFVIIMVIAHCVRTELFLVIVLLLFVFIWGSCRCDAFSTQNL